MALASPPSTREVARAPRVAAAALTLVVAAYFAPVVAGGGLHHNSLTSQMVAQALDPGWPAWREGWDSARYDDSWYVRRLRRSTFRPVSAPFAHAFAGHLHARPGVYFGLLVAAHVAATLLVFRVARRFAGVASAAAAALVFGLHPAAAHVLAGGKFPEFALGCLFGVAALACALEARDAPEASRRWAAGAAACTTLAIFSEESFVALIPIGALWAAFAPGAPAGWRPRDALRVVAPAAVAGLLAAGAQVVHWHLDPRHYVYRHFDGEVAITAGDRLLCAGVDSYLYVRRLLVGFSPHDGPWSRDGGRFADLSVYGPASIGLTALAIAALGLAARRLGVRGRVLAAVFAAPIALALAEPVATRAVHAIARWPSLRQVYFPAAFLSLFLAVTLGALERRGRLAGAAGVAACAAFAAWCAVVGAESTREALSIERGSSAHLALILRGLDAGAPAGARVYLLHHPGGVPNAVWLRLAVGDSRLAATSITTAGDGEADAPEVYTRLDARTLEVRRADGGPFPWLRPPDLAPRFSERAREFLLAGGRRNHMPLLEPRFDEGSAFDIGGMAGDAVVVSEVAGGVPAALQLRLAHPIDDERVVLLAWEGAEPRRLRCPRDGARCAVE